MLGTTLGKHLLGMRVMGPDGDRPTLGEALRRESFVALGGVPFAGPVLALVAWGTIARGATGDPDGRGWHDRFAGGTRVVGE